MTQSEPENSPNALINTALRQTQVRKGQRARIIFLHNALTPGEYDEICRNLSQFFTLLQQWAEEAAKRDEANSQE